MTESTAVARPEQVVGTVARPTSNAAGDFISGIDATWRLASMVAKAPKMTGGRSAEEIMTIWLAAHERGIDYMAALGKMYVVNGKVALEDDLITGLCMKAGVVYEYEESDGSCTVKGTRGQSSAKVTWTMDMAKRAGLENKDNWKKHPETMLMHRARMDVNRRIAPDIVAGLVTRDEISEEARIFDPVTSDAREATRQGIEALKERQGLTAPPTPPGVDESALDRAQARATPAQEGSAEGNLTDPSGNSGDTGSPGTTPSNGGSSEAGADGSHDDLDRLRKRYHAILRDEGIGELERKTWQRLESGIPDSTTEWARTHYVQALGIAEQFPNDFFSVTLNELMDENGNFSVQDRAKVLSRLKYLMSKEDPKDRQRLMQKYTQGIMDFKADEQTTAV